jgi:hypothetical protein
MEYKANAAGPGVKYQALGRRAPGDGVLVVQEGTGWVISRDRETAGQRGFGLVWRVPPAGFEPALTAPEAMSAESSDLRIR